MKANSTNSTENCDNMRDLNSIVQLCSENFSLLSEPYTGISMFLKLKIRTAVI
jgi:hypothetical protein